MNDEPLQILPWGRTIEEQEALERKKTKGRRGAFGCLLWFIALAMFAVYCAGWMAGRHS